MSEQTLSVQHPDMETKSSGTNRWKGWIGGIFFTFVIAVLGYGLSHLPGFDRIGPLASAIVIAVTFRQFSGYPESIRSGIQFSSKKLLRVAIVMYGLRLNIEVVLHDGLPLLVRGAGTILFAIGLTLLLARWLKANTTVSLLLGVGTGVCGAAAIAAVSPILKTEDEDTAISVGIIALVGTVFAIGYTLIKPLMPLDSVSYGIWSGISLHEIAHVALAAAPAGQDALAIALLAKLGRVFLLVPLCFILIYWMKRKHAGEARCQHRVSVVPRRIYPDEFRRNLSPWQSGSRIGECDGGLVQCSKLASDHGHGRSRSQRPSSGFAQQSPPPSHRHGYHFGSALRCHLLCHLTGPEPEPLISIPHSTTIGSSEKQTLV